MRKNHTPWQRELNLSYGLGIVFVAALSILLYFRGMLELTYLVGIMPFVFDLFGP